MKLAWQNIIHDRSRFSVTVLGVSFAVFLMVFQGSLLVGFLRAASRLIDASDSDIWITARGVQAFEFGTTLESRVREMAAGVPGVMQTDRVCMAFAVYRTPKGKQRSEEHTSELQSPMYLVCRLLLEKKTTRT